MVDSWPGGGMRAPWLPCWILLLTAAHMSNTDTHKLLATQAPSNEARPPMKSHGNKNVSIHELLERHSGRVYPTPSKDTTTRLPEFVPDGPRPFIPDPIFQPGETEIVVKVGELAVLPCTVEYLGTRQVSWNKVGREHFLSIGTEIWVQDSNLDVAHYVLPGGVTEWHLVFREARLEDSGLYDCQIISTEKLTSRVQLRVLDIPPHNPEISIEGKEFVESGQTVYLKCNTTEGDRIPEDLDWFKDGDKIEAKEYPNILITKFRFKDTMTLVSEMMITTGTGNDSGTYICRSSSGLIASVEVNVLVADSSNVKRGTGTSHTQTGSGQNYGNAAIYYHFFGGKPQIFCVVVFAHFTINNIIT